MKRYYWADALRVIASVMVVVIHICGVGWYAMKPVGLDWITVNTIDSLCRAAVPIFFMISGAMMLRQEVEPKKLLIKTARLMTLWLMASLFYALVNGDIAYNLTHPSSLISLTLKSHYHLWFLRTLAGIYLIFPVLKALTEYQQGKWVPWYLIVFFAFGVLRQSAGQIPIESSTYNTLRLLMVPELCQYSGYFVLGWYLSLDKQRISKMVLITAYICAAAVIAIGTHLLSQGTAENDERLYAYMGLPVFVQSVSLFLLAMRIKPGHAMRIISFLSPLTLGIYIFHPYAIKLLEFLGFTSDTLPRLLSLPIIVVIAFAASAVVTYLLRKIPKVGKIL